MYINLSSKREFNSTIFYNKNSNVESFLKAALKKYSVKTLVRFIDYNRNEMYDGRDYIHIEAYLDNETGRYYEDYLTELKASL